MLPGISVPRQARLPSIGHGGRVNRTGGAERAGGRLKPAGATTEILQPVETGPQGLERVP